MSTCSDLISDSRDQPVPTPVLPTSPEALYHEAQTHCLEPTLQPQLYHHARQQRP
ncbi:hypothetical protein BDZ85DRAFT_257486 [Elsinoe ampelina]|uniref:Uncharacterized protein n=1 Tax=Elsinoe ampelina TaxID=302913 RepID=A0A6A6GIG6_9PEZI|nr:hypothetical protein BDZ85DRAFT_257486 [Elsinoe ampelina]